MPHVACTLNMPPLLPLMTAYVGMQFALTTPGPGCPTDYWNLVLCLDPHDPVDGHRGRQPAGAQCQQLTCCARIAGCCVACQTPVDLVAIGVSGGGQGGPLPVYHAARSVWTIKCTYGPEGGVRLGGGMYCDLLADWSVPTALTYFEASEQTFLVAQLKNKQ
jgi:hypothetical protein